MKWKISLMMNMLKKSKRKEFGIKLKRTLFGKEIKKINIPSKKKVKKLIFNGKRNQNFPFLKLVKSKTKEKQIWPNKVGFKEENSDMVGKKERKEDQEEIFILKTIKQRSSKKD